MGETIQVRRGPQSRLPVLDNGEIALTTDTKDVYIGTPTGNELIGGQTITSSLADIVTNVKSFGAKGDGITDDALAIQNAINSLIGKGGVIHFPAGTYKIATSISIPQDWIFMLKGVGVDSTILKYTGSDDAINAIGTPTNQIVKSGIVDMRITGNANAKNGVDLQRGYAFYMRNVIIDNFINGIRTEQSWSLIFDFVRVNSCSGNGLQLMDESNNVTVLGSEFFNNGNAGVYVNGGRSVNFISCTLETNNYGAYVTSDTNGTSHSIKFSGCYIEGNTINEIRVTKESGVAPTAINIKDCYFVAMVGKSILGVRLDHATGVTIDGNQFSDGTASYLHSLYLSDGASVSNIKFGTNEDASDNKVYTGAGTYYRNENKQTTKAWGRFTVSGGAIDTVNYFNVASITRVSAGVYEVTLKESMPDINYCIMTNAENGSSVVGMLSSPSQPISSTVFRIYTATDAATLADARTVNFSVYA